MFGYPPKPASAYMDLGKIISVCDSIIDAAADINNCSNYISKASTTCNKDALHLDEKTMENEINEVGLGISGSQSNIIGSAEEIKASATALYNRLQSIYEEYIREQERLARERERRNHDDNRGGVA